jgi:hypothetical protein
MPRFMPPEVMRLPERLQNYYFNRNIYMKNTINLQIIQVTNRNGIFEISDPVVFRFRIIWLTNELTRHNTDAQPFTTCTSCGRCSGAGWTVFMPYLCVESALYQLKMPHQ